MECGNKSKITPDSDLEHCVGGKGYDDSKQTKDHGRRIFLGRTDSGPVVFEMLNRNHQDLPN